jgi:hypothetical protein
MGTGTLYNIGSVSSQFISGGTISVGTFNILADTISGLCEPTYPSAASNKYYVDAVSGSLKSQIGAGTLSGRMVGHIGGNDRTYGISGLQFISSQYMSVMTSSQGISKLKFLEGQEGYGFSIIYSGSWNNNLYIKRNDAGDIHGEEVASICRETGVISANRLHTNSLSSQMISGGTILTSTFNINANTISGLIECTFPSAAANKYYVDAVSGSLHAQIGGGSLTGHMVGDIGGVDYAYEISGLKSLDTKVLSVSGNAVLSGNTVFRRYSSPVLDIRRYSIYTTSLIDGPRLSKHQEPGTTAGAGTGIGFVFQADNASGTDTRIGIFGGVLANATAGTEVGELVFNAVSSGADPTSPPRHLTIRGQDVGTGDNTGVKGYVGVPYRFQTGKDLKDGYPSVPFEVSGDAVIYSGSIYTRKGAVSSQNISGQWFVPIVRGLGKTSLTADADHEGQIWRTSGTAGTGTPPNQYQTYVWICLKNSSGGYEFVKLAESS